MGPRTHVSLIQNAYPCFIVGFLSPTSMPHEDRHADGKARWSELESPPDRRHAQGRLPEATRGR